MPVSLTSFTNKRSRRNKLLADPQKDPAATTEDRLRLGQTFKSQADLLRLNGHFAQARPAFDQAIAELERAHAADAEQAEVRNELALAVDARGWVNREIGDFTAAENDFRRAFELLEKLVAEFPTVPRHREVLAKVCNSLGMLEKDTGRLDEAEIHLRRQVPLARRLAEDFPDRPEYRTILGRALSNLGIALFESGRSRRIRADPSRGHRTEYTDHASSRPTTSRSGSTWPRPTTIWARRSMRQGNAEAAIAEFRKAQAINEAMIKVSPDKPRYRSDLGSDLDSLAVAMSALGPAQGRRDLRRRQRDLRTVDRRSSRKHRLPDPPSHVPAQRRRRAAPGGPDRTGRADLSQGARPARFHRPQAPDCGLPALAGQDSVQLGRDSRRWRRGRLETLDRHLAAAPGRQAGGRRRPAQPGHRPEQPRDAAGGPQTPR